LGWFALRLGGDDAPDRRAISLRPTLLRSWIATGMS